MWQGVRMEIKRNTPFLARQGFSELLDNAFKMMGHTWRTSLFLSLALLLPLCALMGWAAAEFLGGLTDWPGFSANAAQTLGFLYLRFVLVLSAGSLLLQFAGLFVYVAVSTHVAAAAGGWNLEFGEIVRRAGRRHYGRCLLQYLVQVAMLAGIVSVAVLLVVPPLIFSLTGKAPGVAAVAGTGGAILVGTVAAVWLSVLLRFAPQAVVFDGEAVFGSLQHSAHLVRGSWWRLFGISIVVGIIFSFAVGLVTFPVTGVALLPLLSRLIGLILGNSLEPSRVAELLRRGAVLIAVAVAGSAFIRAAIEAFFMPVFFGQFYIDLKVRKGELALPQRRAERRVPRARRERKGR
jgi:hypothetical protein